MTGPIRRLRVVPNPNATAATVVSTGGRHRKPDPDDDADGPDAGYREATTEVVPTQRVASLTVPPPVA